MTAGYDYGLFTCNKSLLKTAEKRRHVEINAAHASRQWQPNRENAFQCVCHDILAAVIEIAAGMFSKM